MQVLPFENVKTKLKPQSHQILPASELAMRKSFIKCRRVWSWSLGRIIINSFAENPLYGNGEYSDQDKENILSLTEARSASVNYFRKPENRHRAE